MEIKQVAYFMWVYEERSFSRAARRAQVVQPTLSMHIRKMEEEFGVKLFDRRPRGVEPTAAGHKLYDRCVPIAQNLELAQQEMAEADHRQNVGGSVKIGLPSPFNRGLLSAVLIPFMERYPDVHISIAEAYTGTLVEWVQNGLVDFALGARPVNEGGLVRKLIYRDRIVLISSVALNGISFSPCDLSRISGLKLILPPATHSVGAIAQEYLANGSIKAAKTIEINGSVASFDLMQSSDWGLLTPFVSVFKDAGDPGLFIYPIGAPRIPFDLYLVYDGRRPLNAASRRLIDAIAEKLKLVEDRWARMQLPSQKMPSSP